MAWTDGTTEVYALVEELEEENRGLKAEIERLQSMNQAKLDMIYDLMTEIERYKKTVGELVINDDGTAFATLIGEKTEYIDKKVAKIFKNMAVKKAKAKAIKDVELTLEAEVESSNKYIREYDGSEVQKAYNQGLKTAYNIVKEMVGD